MSHFDFPPESPSDSVGELREWGTWAFWLFYTSCLSEVEAVSRRSPSICVTVKRRTFISENCDFSGDMCVLSDLTDGFTCLHSP